MKKVPLPIRIWPLKEAPRRYRELLREEHKKELIDEGTARDMKWVASVKGEMARRVFWGPFKGPARLGSFAQTTRAGVIFHFTDLGDEYVYFFSNNDEDMEISAGM
jgi:hypothetical protein